MSDSLSQAQITSLTACTIWGGLSLFAAVGNQLGHHIWLATLVVCLAGIAAYLLLARWLQSSAAQRLGGAGPGRLASALGLLYALLVTAVIIASAVELWQAWTVADLPFIVCALLLMLAMGYGGIAQDRLVPARLSALTVFMLLVMAAVDTLLLLPGMRLSRLQPLATVDFSTLAVVSALQFAVLLAGMPLLMFLLPQAKTVDGAKKGLRRGLALGLGYALLMEIRNVLLLGDLLTLERYPLIRALKMVEAGIGWSRLEYFGILALLGVAVNAGMIMLSVGSICWKRLFINKNAGKI